MARQLGDGPEVVFNEVRITTADTWPVRGTKLGFGGELSEHKGAFEMESLCQLNREMETARNKRRLNIKEEDETKGSVYFSTSLYRLDASTFIFASAIFLAFDNVTTG